MCAAVSHAPPQVALMPALTGIRFPLALWVVAHHLSGPGRMFDPITAASETAFEVIDAAWVALSVFFAISGFVLARRYYATTWDRPALTRYAVARFGRVYPVYLISLLILVPIISEEWRAGRFATTEQASLLLNHVLLLQGWQRPVVNWNTPAWSLSCEVFFYTVFPLVMLLVRRATWPRIAAATALAFALPIALRLLIEPPIAKALLYFGDFLIGVTAGLAYDRVRAATTVPLSRFGPWLYGAALAVGLLLLLARDSLGSFLVFDAGIRLTSAMLVFGLACGGGAVWRWMSSPVMVGGGRAAYAIYILHVPVLWWYERSDLRAGLPPVLAGAVYVSMVVVLSIVVSRHIEEPANDIIRRWFAGRRTRRISAAAVADVALPTSRPPREG